MNTNKINPDADEKFLDVFFEAANNELPEESLDAATARARSRLPSQAPRTRTQFMSWRLAGATGFAVAALMLVPLLMPGHNGSAFAEAQAWFEAYRTLHVTTVMEQNGNRFSRMEVWADDKGSVRIEMDPVTHIIDAGSDTMHILLPGNQVMSKPVLTAGSTGPSDKTFAWVQDIRDFQGDAQVLEETRVIEGIEASGYSLSVDGSSFILWVDPADNRPLQVEGELPGGLTMRSDLQFDMALPAGAFTVPAHYRRLDAQD